MIDIHDKLKVRNSHIAFCIHDSLVIDFAREDRDIISDIVEEFSSTSLGSFKTNVSVGKNFGDMKELTWKQS